MATRLSPPLKLGGGRVLVYDRDVGQVLDPTLRVTQQKIEHSTNYGLRYRKDAKLAIMESMEISWVFQYITPFNANVLVGMPGWSGVPSDRKLGGTRQALDIISGASYGVSQTEYSSLTDSAEGLPQFSPLQYRLFNASPTSPGGVVNVFAQNTENIAAIVGYRGIVVDLGGAGGGHTLPSNIFVVPVYSATLDDIDVTATWDFVTMTPPPTTISVYMFTYTYSSTYQSYIGTYAAANAKLFEDALTAPEIAAGRAVRTITSTMVGLTTHAGFPVNPMTVTLVETGAAKAWITDYEYTNFFQGGSGIKRVPTGGIAVDELVKVVYTWNGADAAEMPLGNSGTGNPVVPVTIHSLFHDQESKIFIHLHAVEVLNNFSVAFTANDWMGLAFSGESLDREAVYPNYPFGYIQFYGPIADRIKKNGNTPWGQGIPGYDLGAQQTVWS